MNLVTVLLMINVSCSEKIINPVEDLMAHLGISVGVQTPRGKNSLDRLRTSFLDKDHEAIAGNCTVYRISLGE